MWRPTGLECTDFRGVIELEHDFQEPITMLVGPAGAGKTSVIQAIEWGLTGAVRHPTGSKDQAQAYYRPESGLSPHVALAFQASTDDGPNLALRRDLDRTHRLLVDAAEDGSLNDTQDRLEMRLDATPAQVRTLLHAKEFVTGQSPLEQAGYLLSLAGIDADRDDLYAMLPKGKRRRELAEEALDRLPEEDGWPLLEAALAEAETRRKVAGRAVKDARKETENAQVLLEHVLDNTLQCNSPEEARELAKTLEGEQSVLRERIEGMDATLRQSETLSGMCHSLEGRIEGYTTSLTETQEELDALGGKRAEAAKRIGEVEKLVEDQRGWLAASEARIPVSRTALQAAQAQVELYDARIEALTKSAGGTECPTCGTALAENTRQGLSGEARRLRKEVKDEARTLKEEITEVQGEVKAFQEAIKEGKRELHTLRSLPDPAVLTERLDSTRGFKEGLEEELAARRGDIADLDAIAPADLREQEAGLQALDARAASMRDIIAKGHTREEAAKAESQAVVDHGYWQATVEAWRGGVVELATETVAPILQRVNRLVADLRPWEVQWQPEGIIVDVSYEEDGEVVERQRNLASLSTGEQMLVGAAWQIAFAEALGIGLAVLDDASVLDPKALSKLVRAVDALVTDTDIRFLMATSHLPDPLPDTGVDIVPLYEGRRDPRGLEEVRNPAVE